MIIATPMSKPKKSLVVPLPTGSVSAPRVSNDSVNSVSALKVKTVSKLVVPALGSRNQKFFELLREQNLVSTGKTAVAGSPLYT